jgi:hypothetical protein
MLHLPEEIIKGQQQPLVTIQLDHERLQRPGFSCAIGIFSQLSESPSSSMNITFILKSFPYYSQSSVSLRFAYK